MKRFSPVAHYLGVRGLCDESSGGTPGNGCGAVPIGRTQRRVPGQLRGAYLRMFGMRNGCKKWCNFHRCRPDRVKCPAEGSLTPSGEQTKVDFLVHKPLDTCSCITC